MIGDRSLVKMHATSCTTDPAEEGVEASALTTALHVISTERDALAHLEWLYRTDALAQENTGRAVSQIVKTIQCGGKLVICGVGKSGKIGRKLEATMNSMGIYCVFLHPTEALHGDLGMIRPTDTLLLISFSGRTPELLLLLPHIPQTVPVIAITGHMHPSTCPLLSYNRPDMTILLPAPIHTDEETSFGVCAPTTSTTVALALGDALAIATARSLHITPGRGPAEVFKGFHPGGAIGAASTVSTPKSTSTSTSMTSLNLTPLDEMPKYSNESTLSEPQVKPVIIDLAVPLNKIPTVTAPRQEVRILDILLTAIQNPLAKSWVRLSSMEIVPPWQVRALAQNGSVDTCLADLDMPISVGPESWLRVPGSTSVEEVRRLMSDSTKAGSSDLIISVLDNTESDRCLGFVCGADLCTFLE